MGISRDGANPNVPEQYSKVWRDLRGMEDTPDPSYLSEGPYQEIPDGHREALISVFQIVEKEKSLTFGQINEALDHDTETLKDAVEVASFTGAVCYLGEDGYKLCSI